jgi:hypothetical protein
MRRRASREDDLPIDFIKRRVVIFFGFIFLRVDCGAEDKLKLSDDVIEEAFRWSATVRRAFVFTRSQSSGRSDGSNRRIQFQKRRQLFIRPHNETFPVAAMHNELNQPRQFNRRSHDAVIRVYDDAGNVIETHEHTGEFKEA